MPKNPLLIPDQSIDRFKKQSPYKYIQKTQVAPAIRETIQASRIPANSTGMARDIARGKYGDNPLSPDISDVKPLNQAASAAELSPSSQLYDTYGTITAAKQDTLNRNNRIDPSRDPAIRLTKGRFTGAAVNPNLIRSLVASGRRYGVDPKQMIALAGRESTFMRDKTVDGRNRKDMEGAVSGWDVKNDYFPREPARYMADRGVPGITKTTTTRGMDFALTDKDAADAYLAAHPEVVKGYSRVANQTLPIKNSSSADMAARIIKAKGIAAYNPKAPKYTQQVMADYNTLNSEPALNKFLSTLRRKGGLLYNK